MTLEEMQVVWSEMTEKIDNQKRLTDTLIMEMTQQKFNNKIGKISRIEGIGAAVCFMMALLLLMFMNRLDTWYLLGMGLFVFLYLLIAPILILRSIIQMKTVDFTTSSVKNSLLVFTRRRKNFLFLQRLFINLNIVLIIMILPVAKKIFSDKNLFLENQSVWLWYIPLMLLFMVPFSIWGYKNYKNMTASAEKLIQDMASRE